MLSVASKSSVFVITPTKAKEIKDKNDNNGQFIYRDDSLIDMGNSTFRGGLRHTEDIVVNGTNSSNEEDAHDHGKRYSGGNRYSKASKPMESDLRANARASDDIYISSTQQLVSEEIRPASLLPQILAAVVMSVLLVSVGTAYGFTGTTLSQLTNNSSSYDDLVLSSSGMALCSSLTNLGGVAGSCIGGWLLLKLGRRSSLLLATFAAVIVWFILANSPSELVLLSMRFLQGVTVGPMEVGATTYILEISHQDLRGTFAGTLITARQFGILLVNSIGGYLTWRQAAMVCGGVTFLPIIPSYFLPRSPRWLVNQNRLNEARQSLTFFRGPKYIIEPEIKTIVIDQVGESSRGANNTLKELKGIAYPPVLKKFIFLFFFTLLSVWNGIGIMTVYLGIIFERANAGDPYINAILVCVVRVIGALVYIALVDRVGRKPLTVISYASSACFECVLGGYFYMMKYISVIGLEWLPLTSMIFFLFFVSFSQSALSLLQGELLPTSVRSTGVSILYVVSCTGAFTCGVTFPSIADVIGEYGAFWLYGFVCFVLCLMMIVFLPETRGKSLEEISRSKNVDVEEHK